MKNRKKKLAKSAVLLYNKKGQIGDRLYPLSYLIDYQEDNTNGIKESVSY